MMYMVRLSTYDISRRNRLLAGSCDPASSQMKSSIYMGSLFARVKDSHYFITFLKTK
jgi:hypothetical protein